MDLHKIIRQIPNFPKPGINFYDVTSLTEDKNTFRFVVDSLSDRYTDKNLDAVVAIDARGFIFGSALAYKLGTAIVPVRKAGKLPPQVEQVSYTLEYGQDKLEIRKDALKPGARVIVVDDLLATGGTAKGALDLVSKLKGNVLECCFVIELTALQGSSKLNPVPTYSLLQFND